MSIAGMGGETIAAILSAAEWVKEKRLPLILQPMTAQPELRRWLTRNGYAILEEKLAQEGELIYVILSARAGESAPMGSAEEWAGRQFPGMDAPLRGAYLDHLLRKAGRALEGMARSRMGRELPGYHELEQVYEGLLEMKKEWEQWLR